MSNLKQSVIFFVLIVMLLLNSFAMRAYSYLYFTDIHCDLNNSITLIEEGKMHHNTDPPFDFHDEDDWGFRSLRPNRELLEIENELRQRFLIHDPYVQWLVDKAAYASEESSQWAISQLRMILDAEEIEIHRTDDVYRPLGPIQLLDNGNLHLYNQVDGVPWRIPVDALTRGLILTGSQGGGKTRLLIHLLRQFNSFMPSIPWFALDPKQELKDWASYLSSTYTEISDISLDLSPPPGLTYEQFLPSLMPQLADILGLVYGTEILQQAAVICIDLRNQYIQKTGQNTEISLLDIYNAVPFVKDSSKGRRLGYREAVSTSLGRILSGSGDLFKCRQGIDLATLFNHRVILGTRSITDDFAAKFLALSLLYWLYESERFSPPSDQAKRALIIDDASRYISVRPGFDAATTTSSFTNIYTRLRSSGNCVITTTQVPHLADPGILALSHTVINVGPLHYGKDTRLLAEMMGLDDRQRLGLSKLMPREAVGRAGGTAWSGIVRGKTVDVNK